MSPRENKEYFNYKVIIWQFISVTKMNNLYVEGLDNNVRTEMIICYEMSYDRCRLFLYIFSSLKLYIRNI